MSDRKMAKALCDEVIRLLKEARERKAMSKYALAQRSGVSPQMIGYIEQGKRNPTLETLVLIAHGMGVDLAATIARAQKRVK